MIEAYVERDQDLAAIVGSGLDAAAVEDIVRRIDGTSTSADRPRPA